MRHLTATIRTVAKSNASDSALRRSTAAIVGALVLASIAARSNAAPAIPAPDQLAQVQEICGTVIRVQPDDEHFDGCVSSLMGSLESASRERAVVHGRNKCFVEGLKPGSSDLAGCLLQAADAAPSSDMMNAPVQVSRST
jgi:hypothetical protein